MIPLFWYCNCHQKVTSRYLVMLLICSLPVIIRDKIFSLFYLKKRTILNEIGLAKIIEWANFI